MKALLMALIYLAEITAYNGGSTTLRYSSGAGYNMHTSFYPGRIKEVVQYAFALSADPRAGGPQISGGKLVLKDDDQALKALLPSYGIAGFTCTILVGDSNAAYASFTTLLTAKMSEPVYDATTVTIGFLDRLQDLRVPLAKFTFAGTNATTGVEGTASDVGSQFKPVAYGRLRQVQAVPANAVRAVDQVHDGQVSDVVAGRDKGVAITKGSTRTFANIDNGSEPTAGTFDYFVGDASHGAYVRRVSTLLSAGPFTYDVDGDARGGTFRTTPADIAKEIVTQRVTSGPAVTDADRTALNTATGSPGCGFWNRDNVTVDVMLDQLMVSAGAKWWIDNTGYRMARLAAPTGSAVANIRRIAGAVTRSSIDADIRTWKVLPPDVPIVWKVTVRFQRYWLPQTQGLDANIDQALRGQLQNEWRSTVASDASVLTQYPAAVEITVDTLLDAKADADALAAAILALLKVRRDYILFDLQCSATVAALIASATARVDVFDIMDYGTSGRQMIVLGYGAYDQDAGVLPSVKVFG